MTQSLRHCLNPKQTEGRFHLGRRRVSPSTFPAQSNLPQSINQSSKQASTGRYRIPLSPLNLFPCSRKSSLGEAILSCGCWELTGKERAKQLLPLRLSIVLLFVFKSDGKKHKRSTYCLILLVCELKIKCPELLMVRALPQRVITTHR